jgi:electron transfer flavoprotein alpha subunit
MSGIFVVAEHRKGVLRDITFEMLKKGRELAAQSDGRLTAVLLGKNTADFAARLSKAADEVLVIEDDRLENFNGEIYQNILAALIDERKPLLTITGHTAAGMDFAASLAAAKNIAIAADCVDLKFEGTKLIATRQLYSGKVNAELSFKQADSYIVTLRSGIFPFDEASASGAGSITKEDCPSIAESSKKFIAYIEALSGAVDITQADVLVSVGQGIGDVKNIPMMESFAAALGASLSCSRPVVDRKWLPQERQVGSSGKTVKPKVYLAVGISGAFQHVTAVKADTIIAINKDPRAPIFGVADYGITGDLFQIIPKLQEEVLKLKGGK